MTANVGKPQVAYRETAGQRLSLPIEYDREIGGKRQYARLVLELVPRARGAGNTFTNLLPEPVARTGKGGPPAVPAKLLPDMIAAVREGVSDAMTRGPLLGYAMVDVEIRLLDGGYVEGDSTPHGVPGRDLDGAHGSLRKGLSDPVGAGDEGGDRGPRGLHRTRGLRPQRSSRPHPRDGTPSRPAGRRFGGSFVGNGRLCYRPPLKYAGSAPATRCTSATTPRSRRTCRRPSLPERGGTDPGRPRIGLKTLGRGAMDRAFAKPRKLVDPATLPLFPPRQDP